jgi:penicillin amidase
MFGAMSNRLQGPYRLFARTLMVLLLLVAIIAASVAGMVWLTFPPRHQQAAISGLSAPVDISFDADGIPRLHAQTDLDAAAALGFVHARDRLFQMDLMRRAASGRLSEMAGPATLPIDRLMRTLGVRQAAQAELDAMPKDTRALLDAYSRGVNAYIALRGRFAAPEFLVFGRPQPWTALDCLLWGKTLGLWLSGNEQMELARAALVGKASPQQIEQLWPDTQAALPEASAEPVRRMAESLLATLPRFPDPFTLPATASNEWAVDGRHTASGAPLLAGDPHLGFGLPGIWYLARIETPHGVLAGATAPGVPFLVLGHNGHIAWTFTTTGADTEDVFEETVIDAGHYLGPDGPLPFTVREERIHVRGQPDEVLRVRETRHGPVISDLPGTHAPKNMVLAVRMASLLPGNTPATGLLALNRAKDVAEAGRAAPIITAPVQNLLVADRQRIAFYTTGRVPVRRSGDGAAPVPGADGAFDWIGWASGDQLPHSVAPASGHLVNANERTAPPDFPVFMGRVFPGDWRARRIREMLAARKGLTVADFVSMQADTQSVYAERLLPVLRQVATRGALAHQAVALLQNWHGEMDRNRPQPLIFNAWMQAFRTAVLARANLPPSSAGMGFVPVVLGPQGAAWCGGNCSTLLQQTLETTTDRLAAYYGEDPSRWRWGDAHQAIFAHPILNRVPILGWWTTARIPTGGDGSTVDAAGMRPNALDAVHGPSFRGVYDLADLDRSQFVAAPGQSGNPFAEQARDMLRRWRDGRTVSLASVPATVAAILQLTPGQPP